MKHRHWGALRVCGLTPGHMGRPWCEPAVVTIGTHRGPVYPCRACADRLAEIVRDAKAEHARRVHEWAA